MWNKPVLRSCTMRSFPARIMHLPSRCGPAAHLYQPFAARASLCPSSRELSRAQMSKRATRLHAHSDETATLHPLLSAKCVMHATRDCYSLVGTSEFAIVLEQLSDSVYRHLKLHFSMKVASLESIDRQ